MENDLLRISFIGEGFLRYMVRMLTGCLLEVGKHHMSINDVKKILDAKDKKIFRHNVIGNGLYLMHIDYFKMFYDGENFIIRECLEKDDIRQLISKAAQKNPIAEAYRILLNEIKQSDNDVAYIIDPDAIQEAIGYLGEVLE